MSKIIDNIIGRGEPSQIVQNILNGVDSPVYIKQEVVNSPRKCSHCGSTAQPQLIDVDYTEDKHANNIYKLATYKCSCGHLWLTSTTYKNQHDERIIDDNI